MFLRGYLHVPPVVIGFSIENIKKIDEIIYKKERIPPTLYIFIQYKYFDLITDLITMLNNSLLALHKILRQS